MRRQIGSQTWSPPRPGICAAYSSATLPERARQWATWPTTGLRSKTASSHLPSIQGLAKGVNKVLVGEAPGRASSRSEGLQGSGLWPDWKQRLSPASAKRRKAKPVVRRRRPQKDARSEAEALFCGAGIRRATTESGDGWARESTGQRARCRLITRR
jgi:hypothetical protein